MGATLPDACGRPFVCSIKPGLMSEQSIPALGQPRFPARGDVSEGCSAQMLSSELAQSSCRVLGTASYRTAGLVVTCFDKALFGGIIHRSCCGITRFTEPSRCLLWLCCSSCCPRLRTLSLHASDVLLCRLHGRSQPTTGNAHSLSRALVQELQSVIEIAPASSAPRRSRDTWLSLG